MYDLYVMYLSKNIQHLEEQGRTQHNLIEAQLKALADAKPFIEHYVNYNDLLNGKIKELPTEFSNVIINFKFNNITVKNYYFMFNQLMDIEKKIQNFKKQKITYSLYRKVLSHHNRLALSYCFETGKPFTNKYFGTLDLRYKSPSQVSTRVNWVESKKKAKEITERGGKLYYIKEAEEAAAKGEPYEAENWIVHGFDTGFLFWKWSVSVLVGTEIKKEGFNYKFIPARGNYGSVNIIAQALKNPNHDYSIYTT